MRAPLQVSLLLPNFSTALSSPSFLPPLKYRFLRIFFRKACWRQKITLVRSLCNILRLLLTDMLPDHDTVLLPIFDLCAGDNLLKFITRKEIEAWRLLVHVCRR